MRILISNDDGYFSPGIEALAAVAREFGEVTVVAPERDRSGASNSLTLDLPLSVRVAANGFLYVNGTPTDCVHVAITGLLEHRPDLVLSGINDGANMGDDTLYSGTVAAAMEGYLLGVPAIAFSLVKKGYKHLDSAALAARQVIERWIRRPLPGPVLLNVNIPACSDEERQGVRVTRLGRRHLAEAAVRQRSPRGDTIWWIGPAGRAREAGPGTDFHAIDNRWISITPLDVDLTGVRLLRDVEDWAAA
ncbi:MAG: 5'/3'-nucleotidase SurE [Gammaproteobacteria bacterium]